MKKETEKLLNNVYIAASCPVTWDSMEGDDKVRQCSGCEKSVFNLSAMTEQEAEAFLQQYGDSQCLQFYRRADGTIMTDNCPVGLRKLRDRMRAITKVAASIVAFVVSMPWSSAQTSKSKDASAEKKQPTQQQSTKATKPSEATQTVKPSTAPPKSQMMTGGKPVCPSIETVPEPTPQVKVQTFNPGSKAQHEAFSLYQQGQEAQKKKNFDSAQTYYQRALDAYDAQKAPGDPALRKLIEKDLKELKNARVH